MADNYDTFGVAPNWGGPNYSGGVFGGNDTAYGTGWNNYAESFGGGGGTGNFGYFGHGGFGTPNRYGNMEGGGFWNGEPAGAYGYEPYVGTGAGNAAGSYGSGGSSGYWPGWGYGQPNYQQPQHHLSDRQIEQHVSDALDSSPVTTNADINVQVQDHAVTLTGQVKSRHAKMLADHIAWNSPGVNDVHNQIKVTGRSAAVS